MSDRSSEARETSDCKNAGRSKRTAMCNMKDVLFIRACGGTSLDIINFENYVYKRMHVVVACARSFNVEYRLPRAPKLETRVLDDMLRLLATLKWAVEKLPRCQHKFCKLIMSRVVGLCTHTSKCDFSYKHARKTCILLREILHQASISRMKVSKHECLLKVIVIARLRF